mmetsp:Transcript_2031/g.3482  ORF Transcript_2031/g.3482 Transcript_2031/m.3482 type:complete len:222 (+) Transcript_2031:198-863(+)
MTYQRLERTASFSLISNDNRHHKPNSRKESNYRAARWVYLSSRSRTAWPLQEETYILDLSLPAGGVDHLAVRYKGIHDLFERFPIRNKVSQNVVVLGRVQPASHVDHALHREHCGCKPENVPSLYSGLFSVASRNNLFCHTAGLAFHHLLLEGDAKRPRDSKHHISATLTKLKRHVRWAISTKKNGVVVCIASVLRLFSFSGLVNIPNRIFAGYLQRARGR